MNENKMLLAEELLSEKRFDKITECNKTFIIAFGKAISEFGYECDGATINKEDCGYFIHFIKTGVKKPPTAKISINNEGIYLCLPFPTRLIFNEKMKKHRNYFENAPEHIKNAFLNGSAPCVHCKDECNKYFYTIDEKLIELCGAVFKFLQPDAEKIPDYMELLSKFYSKKKATGN